jgi:hypothetical protein
MAIQQELKKKSEIRHYEDGGELVIHPLFDSRPDEKVKTEGIPPLKMTKTAKVALISLRLYLIVSMLLLLYYVYTLAIGSR